jgi:thiamine-monophosphate kinase
MLVAGVHFFADDPPGAIARKALRVNLSDLAAKGAEPRGFLLGLGLPGDWEEDWLKAFAAGLAEDAAHFSISLLGGDTVHVPGPLTLSITAIGSVPSGLMIRRTTAYEGDRLFVTGTIGDAALGLRLRQNIQADQAWIGELGEGHRAFLLDRYLLPRPRLALREALRDHAHAAMDISDGFAGDLSKMLRLAGLTAEINTDRLPLSEAARAALALEPNLLNTILSGGDDYEIFCTVSPEGSPVFAVRASLAGVPVHEIGVCTRGESPIRFINSAGEFLSLDAGSFQHF